MLKEAYESVVEIAFENAENKEKVKRKKKYVKNRLIIKCCRLFRRCKSNINSNKYNQIDNKKFVIISIYQTSTKNLKKSCENTVISGCKIQIQNRHTITELLNKAIFLNTFHTPST